jgi:SOS-response transcriptional repressor LexA
MTNRPFGLVYEKPSTQKRTARVHRAIQDFIDGHGYPPGYRDIMDLANISSSSVVRAHLARLAKAGTIRYDQRIARSIVLLKRVEVSE